MSVKWFDNYLCNHMSIINQLYYEHIRPIIDLIAQAQQRGNTIFVIGNGGSLANANHFAEDLGKGASDVLEQLCDKKNKVLQIRKSHPGRNRFRVISLSEVSWITALGNDKSFDDVFVEQLKSLSRPSDVLIGISVSGTSPNLVKAFEWAHKNDLINISLMSDKNIDRLDTIHANARHGLLIPSEHYGHVEDVQMFILHAICYYFIENLKNESNN